MDGAQDPYPLLKQFEWDEFDVNTPDSMQEVYTLLNENYVGEREHTTRCTALC